MSILFSFFALDKQPAGDDDLVEVFDSAPELDLDRSWHLLHYLLTGHADPAADASPLGDAIFGGEFLEEDEEMRFLAPDSVARIAAALEEVPEGILRERFNPSALRDAAIYDAHAWEAGGEQMAVDLVRDVMDFYAEAARRGASIFIACEGIGKEFLPVPPSPLPASPLPPSPLPTPKPSVPTLEVCNLWDLEGPLSERLEHEIARVPQPVAATQPLELDVEQGLLALFRIPFFLGTAAGPVIILRGLEDRGRIEPTPRMIVEETPEALLLAPQRKSTSTDWKTWPGLQDIARQLGEVGKQLSGEMQSGEMQLELRCAGMKRVARQVYLGPLEQGTWKLVAWAPAVDSDRLEAALRITRDIDAGRLPKVESEEEGHLLLTALENDQGFGPQFEFELQEQRIQARRRRNAMIVGPPTHPEVLAHFCGKALFDIRLRSVWNE